MKGGQITSGTSGRTWHMDYKKTYNSQIGQLQKQQISIHLGVYGISEWCNSFELVPKPKRKIRECLTPARLNQAAIRPVQSGPTANGILPKLTYIHYFIFIDVTSWYHSLKLDEKSLYLTTCTCQFGSNRYERLPFSSTAPAGDMFQRKIDEFFKELQVTY